MKTQMRKHESGRIGCGTMIGTAIAGFIGFTLLVSDLTKREEFVLDSDGQKIVYSRRMLQSHEGDMSFYQGKDLTEKIYIDRENKVYKDEVKTPNPVTYDEGGVVVEGHRFSKTDKNSLDQKVSSTVDAKLQEAQEKFNRYYEQVTQAYFEKAGGK